MATVIILLVVIGGLAWHSARNLPSVFRQTRCIATDKPPTPLPEELRILDLEAEHWH